VTKMIHPVAGSWQCGAWERLFMAHDCVLEDLRDRLEADAEGRCYSGFSPLTLSVMWES
jgi:hypothetical protein